MTRCPAARRACRRSLPARVGERANADAGGDVRPILSTAFSHQPCEAYVVCAFRITGKSSCIIVSNAGQRRVRRAAVVTRAGGRDVRGAGWSAAGGVDEVPAAGGSSAAYTP